jgi:outer membrane protein TolC
MKKLFFLLLIIAQAAFGQNSDTLTLFGCYKNAIDSFPAGKAKPLLENAFNLKLQNIKTNWYPSLNLNAQASYQSDAISISIPLPTKTISMQSSKDQYKATIDINQLLFDGGTTKAQKGLEKANYSADEQQVDVTLNKLKDQVSQVYFLILVLQENEKLLKMMHGQITEQLKLIESSVKNGVLLPSDYNILKAEALNVEQQLYEIQVNKQASLQILGELTDKYIPENTFFQVPDVQISTDETVSRPEDQFYMKQMDKLEASQKVIQTQRMPKLYAFAQVGYGRPGLNFLSNDFNEFHIVGATLKWNIWDWSKTNRDKKILDVQRDIVKTDKESFDKNMTITLKNQMANIGKYKEFIVKDLELVNLRASIVKTAESQLANGVITVTDYLVQLNAETQAKINLETHKLLLQQAKVNFALTKGDNN